MKRTFRFYLPNLMQGNPLGIACPYCGEPAGEQCIDMDTGEPREVFHQARRIAVLPRQMDRVNRTLESKRGIADRR